MTDNSGAAAGVATGIATGVAIGVAMQEEEKEKQRRLSNRGKDQILLETTKNIDLVGTAIAGMYGNWYYNSENSTVYRRKTKSDYIWTVAGEMLLIGIVVSIVQVCIFFGVLFLFGFQYDHSYPYDAQTGLMISIIISLVIAVYINKDDERVDYIRLSESPGKTRVLIKVYNSEGYRNLDEDELAKMQEKVNGG